MIVKGAVQDCECVFLVDSGSQGTLVNLSLVKELKLEHLIRRTQLGLFTLTNQRIATAGEIDLRLRIAGSCVTHTCVVLVEPMETDVLLGVDFLGRHGVTIDFASRTVTSYNGSSPFSGPPKAISRTEKVRMSSTVVIPPQTVMFIRGTAEVKEGEMYSGCLEPYHNTEANLGILTARALVHTDQNRQIPIRVLNPTDNEVTLYKRKLIGLITPIQQTSNSLRNVRVRHVRNTEAPSSPTPQEDDWTKERLYRELRVDQIDIPKVDKERLKKILWRHKDTFSKHEFDLGTCNFFQAEINLKRDAVPQYVTPIPVPYKHRAVMDEHLREMERAGVIEQTTEKAMWNSRVFLVAKPNQPGKFRLVADFRPLNAQCLPDNYTLPNVNHVADKLRGAEWFTTMDLSKSFWQVNYNQDASKLTAFTANGRTFMFKKMVMGHMNSSSQFARMMDRLLANVDIGQLCYFLDDLCLASADVETHLDRLDLLLQKLSLASLKLMPKKCEILKREIKFVGLTISKQGLCVNDDRVKAVKEIQPPKTLKECQKVMGFLSYNRKFVKGFSALAKPIYALIDKKKKFAWTDECQNGFEEIKRRIAEGITLTIPNIDDPENGYSIILDASVDGYGAELTQLQGGERRTIAYFSKRVPKHKRPWSQSKLEFEGMVEAIKHFDMYIRGTKFEVQTDCLSLLSLENLFANETSATMLRRINKLAEYQFTIRHVAGVDNGVADFLSRYIHKSRCAHAATQTETGLGSVKVNKCVAVVQKTEGAETPMSGDMLSETEPLIPETFFDEESAWESDSMKGERSFELDLTRVQTAPICVCNVEVVSEPEPVVVNAVTTTASGITQQLDIPNLIDVERVKKEQKEDIVLSEVRRWIDEKARPKDVQKLRLPSDLIRYWKYFNLLTVRDDVLCRKWIRHDKVNNEIEIERFLVLVPETLREKVMENHHASLVNCHPGVEGTYQSVVRQYYWPQMRNEIDLYVKSCVTCGVVKPPSKYLRAPLKHILAREFNDVIAIDHIVPEKEGVTPRRNRYILTMVDLFTGYSVAVPCKTKESQETIRIITHHWCLKLGYPKEIIADNDKSFSSSLYNDVLDYFGIKSTHGTPHTCASTSKAERANRRINTALRLTLTNKQLHDWDLYLNFVCFALNGLKSRHTGFSPSLLVFGRQLNCPLDLQIDGENVELNHTAKKNPNAYALFRTIREIMRKARRHAELDFQYMDNQYNKNLSGHVLEEGDWVFCLIPCPSHKFSKRWQGPFCIRKKIDDHLFVVELENGKEKLMNISKLKKYTRSRYSPGQNRVGTHHHPNVPEVEQCEIEEERVPNVEVEVEIQPPHIAGDTEEPHSPTITTEETHQTTETPEPDDSTQEAPVGPVDPVSVPTMRRSGRTRRMPDRFVVGMLRAARLTRAVSWADVVRNISRC